MNKYFAIIKLLVFVSFFSNACGENEDVVAENSDLGMHSMGLQVDADGVVTYKGTAYKGVGVNYFDAFYRNIKDASDTTFMEGFRQLKEYNIHFVRFMAGGFWPSDWELYLNNKDAYFSRFDRIVKSAEDAQIGLMPSLFWNYHTIPDIVGETVNQWGNSRSRTIEFMKTYTKEVVTRYLSSPAILGWEFGNEYSNQIDLPGIKHLPPVWESLGCPSSRSELDKLTSSDLVAALDEFASTIRQIDGSRMIFSGNSIPRESAYHLRIDQTWEVDDINQYNISLDNQDPDVLGSFTIHLYPKEDSKRFADIPNASIKDIIRISMEYSEKKKKPLFLGEFGAPLTLGPTEESVFMEFLECIEKYQVPLSCVWVFDFPPQNSDWNITTTNSRKYMLQEIGKLNDSLYNQK